MKEKFLVLHKTHGMETWVALKEGGYAEVTQWLDSRQCPSECYRIILIGEEIPVCSICPVNHFHVGPSSSVKEASHS